MLTAVHLRSPSERDGPVYPPHVVERACQMVVDRMGPPPLVDPGIRANPYASKPRPGCGTLAISGETLALFHMLSERALQMAQAQAQEAEGQIHAQGEAEAEGEMVSGMRPKDAGEATGPRTAVTGTRPKPVRRPKLRIIIPGLAPPGILGSPMPRRPTARQLRQLIFSGRPPETDDDERQGTPTPRPMLPTSRVLTYGEEMAAVAMQRQGRGSRGVSLAEVPSVNPAPVGPRTPPVADIWESPTDCEGSHSDPFEFDRPPWDAIVAGASMDSSLTLVPDEASDTMSDEEGASTEDAEEGDGSEVKLVGAELEGQ